VQIPRLTAVGVATTPVLEIAYEAAGPPDGPVAVLLHGFPYDVRCYDAAAAILARDGVRVIAPYLRGYGPTRYRYPDTLRSGQQGPSGRTCWTCSTRSGLSGPSWAATTGAGARPVSPPRSHPNA
jgi:pimeloyl-ACP methyl ester carboxylesterase